MADSYHPPRELNRLVQWSSRERSGVTCVAFRSGIEGTQCRHAFSNECSAIDIQLPVRRPASDIASLMTRTDARQGSVINIVGTETAFAREDLSAVTLRTVIEQVGRNDQKQVWWMSLPFYERLTKKGTRIEGLFHDVLQLNVESSLPPPTPPELEIEIASHGWLRENIAVIADEWYSSLYGRGPMTERIENTRIGQTGKVLRRTRSLEVQIRQWKDRAAKSSDAAERSIHRLSSLWMHAEAVGDLSRGDDFAAILCEVIQLTQALSNTFERPVNRSEGLAALVLYVDLAMRFPFGRKLSTLESVAQVINSDDLTYRLALKSARVLSVAADLEGAETYLLALLDRVGPGREKGDRAIVEWSYARLLGRLGRPREGIVLATESLVEFGRFSADDFDLPQAATHLLLAHLRSQLGEDPVPDLITALHAIERGLNSYWESANDPIGGIDYLARQLETYGQDEAAQVARRLLKFSANDAIN